MTWNPPALYGSVIWLVYTVVGLGVAVVIATFVALAVAGSELSVGSFTDGGQFAVYTASMLVGALYLTNKPDASRLPFTEWFGLATLVGVILSATVIFGGTLVSNQFEVNGEPLDPEIYRWPSVGLFAVAALLAAFAVYLDAIRPSRDLRGEREKEIRELTADVGALLVEQEDDD